MPAASPQGKDTDSWGVEGTQPQTAPWDTTVHPCWLDPRGWGQPYRKVSNSATMLSASASHTGSNPSFDAVSNLATFAALKHGRGRWEE
jgi:hypothetical protein